MINDEKQYFYESIVKLFAAKEKVRISFKGKTFPIYPTKGNESKYKYLSKCLPITFAQVHMLHYQIIVSILRSYEDT